MQFRQALITFVILLAASGCYQQAGDDFQSVESQDSPPTAEASPTSAVVIIEPEESGQTTPTLEVVQLEPTEVTNTTAAESVEPTSTPMPASTPTVIIIIPGDDEEENTPIPVPATNTVPVVATATEFTLITPEVPSQIELDTATPEATTRTGPAGNGLLTPTALDQETSSDCVHIVQAGDTLFRIALNNGVSLADLLATNNLSEQSIIQPGDSILIPNCGVESVVETPLPASTDAIIPPVGPTEPGDVTVHRVSAGETLSIIARRYGVAIADIMQANNLTDPDRLSVGQELVIPNQ